MPQSIRRWLTILSCGLALCASRAHADIKLPGATGEPEPTTTAGRFDVLEAKITNATGADRRVACTKLYAFVQEIMRAAEGTPGKEAANFLRTGNLARAVEDLKNGRAPDARGLNAIRTQTLLAGSGPTWPRPPAIDVPYAKTPPLIDGHLDDAVWAAAVVFTNSYRFNETNVAPIQTTYRMLWDTNYLYFAFDCGDADIVAPIQPRDTAIYQNDCVEMFILPELRFRTYWELDISPAGCIYDSLQFKKLDEWGAVMEPAEDMAGLQVGVSIRGTRNAAPGQAPGYIVEVAVPFNQLPGYTQCPPAPGQTLYLMLARLDRNGTPGSTNDEFHAYAFTPLLSWGHNLWNHAKITLKR